MTATDRPNVLLVCTDHWPAELLGVAGHPVIRTPGLDQIALAGTRFTNCYSECPVCIPARRSLMTGLSPRSHGDRSFTENLAMPDATTLPQAFRDAGYQADAVGKLHVHPQRDRIGFDSVLLDEEGRTQFGMVDDYDTYLGDRGFAGRQYDHGMSTNQYDWRPWHLDDDLHVTNWATRAMARTIKRRDPTRPAFWYLGYRHPHPPLVPLQTYVDLYRDIEMDAPYVADWAQGGNLPYPIAAMQGRARLHSDSAILEARRAFYALCTHIDHQIRWLIGTLRQEKILDNTIVVFMSDHGDMLGNHGTVAKRLFYECSANVPMIVMGTKDNPRLQNRDTDDRLMGLRDVMPTLLDMCGIDAPGSIDGMSMADSQQREYIYGEWGEDDSACRMIRDQRYKLIYYPVGNLFQLFDLNDDPREMTNLSADTAHADVLTRMQEALRRELYGADLNWLDGDTFVGLPDKTYSWRADRGLHFQRGEGWPR
ncbi:MAG: sulfatase-like hydrolase/transferase [Rhodobacteraceae bacterium]|nr:sulfatase-like hydrolase/transferase [Paracoccaceae bacterium]